MNKQKMKIDTTRTSYSNFPRDMKQSIKTKSGTYYLVKSQVQKDKHLHTQKNRAPQQLALPSRPH